MIFVTLQQIVVNQQYINETQCKTDQVHNFPSTQETFFNEEEFPRSFTKGSYEGFWWAFVTMTTVG